MTLSCWVLTEDKVGMISQCWGLAEALGVQPLQKIWTPRAPWKFLPPALWCCALRSGRAGSDLLAPPWPDLLIATGRPTVAVARAIRRVSAGATFTVQIQNPGIALHHFDMVVAPQHDNLQGPNVFNTRGALHRVTAARLATAATQWAPSLAHLPQPRAAVLLGGSNRRYRFTAAIAAQLAQQLAALARSGIGLMITPSRRTDPAVVSTLRNALRELPAVIWDGAGDNPYFAYLGLADHVIVTGDSVNMVSEACATGKPVYIVELAGRSAKFERFHAALRAAGMTRPFEGSLAQWHYPPLDDVGAAAAEIKRRLRATGRSGAQAPGN